MFEDVSKNGQMPSNLKACAKVRRPINFPKKVGKEKKGSEKKWQDKTRQATCRTVSKRSSQRDEQLKADWRASKVVEDAKDLAPVKTGKLRESIKATPIADGAIFKITASFSDINHENLWNYSLKKYRRNIYYVL